MFSDVIKNALEEEVIGQSGAVHSVVRGVTRAIGGLVPREGPLCAYMFMGPTGTGKTHLVRTLARTLHGDPRRLIVADCTQFVHGDPWMAFVAQLMPLFAPPGHDDKWAVLDTPPLSIVLVEYLERGPKELAKALGVALETGQLSLPEGRRGSLRNCLIFITTGLCAREILDEAPRIGFTPSAETEDEEDAEQGKLFQACLEQAHEHFGGDLMGRLDRLVLFHRLQEEHLSRILQRLAVELNRWLALRGFSCEMLPEARTFLLERGRRNLRLGARDLVRAYRRLVEFPVADLTVSGRIPAGGLVRVDRHPGEDHLHFTVCERDAAAERPRAGRVPVVWEEAAPS